MEVLKRTYIPVCKPRWTSPGCRTITSVPTPHANYRETNASRLRQEIKGMSITGIIRKGNRSGSTSPSKKKSSNSSPTRSLNGDSTAPKKKESEKTIDLMSTPRTMSETSNSSRDTQEKFKMGAGQPGYLCDTRSKTLNTTTNSSTDKILSLVKMEAQKDKKESPSMAHISPSITLKVNNTVSYSNCKGYGKPLVTPLNRKLSIRRDCTYQDPAPVSKESSHIQVKPLLPRSPVSVMSRQPVSKPFVYKQPYKTNHVIHRAPFNTSPKVSDNLGKSQLPTKETPTTSANASHGNNPSALKKKTLDVRSRSIVKPQRPMSAITNRFDRSKERSIASEYKPRDIKSATNRNKARPMPEQKPENPVSGSVPKVTTIRSSLTRIPMKIHSENSIKQRKFSTEKLKQQFCRDTPVYAAGRPNSAIHSTARTFKPQLEDIKSSYLLLNKRELENEKSLKSKANSIADRGVEETVVVHEPSILDLEDIERKEQLNKIKQKFKSRRFFRDSRYEKIEGLNWISWKD